MDGLEEKASKILVSMNLEVNKKILKRVLTPVVGSMSAGINLQIQFPTSYSTWNPLHSVTAHKLEFFTM
jgi:hypothetical protein